MVAEDGEICYSSGCWDFWGLMNAAAITSATMNRTPASSCPSRPLLPHTQSRSFGHAGLTAWPARWPFILRRGRLKPGTAD